MSGVLLVALIWPVVLLGIGLLVGRALQRGDRLAERRPPVPHRPDAAEQSGSDGDLPLRATDAS